MPVQTVAHIADVSFKDHFLGLNGEAPVNGKIKVNHNTFDVSFANGRVQARFASGNWFTNLFRGGTRDRFTQTLQTQYDSWVQEKAKASAADAGFKDNPNVSAIKKAVDACFDILYADRAKYDATTVDCSKDVMKAFAMRHTDVPLDPADAERLENYIANGSMPPNLAKYLDRLGQIAELAAVRNELTTVATGTEANNILQTRLEFLTHMDENCAGKSEAEKKRYVLNMVDTVIDGFLQAVNTMKDRNAGVVEFLRAFDGACVEAKSDNVQEWAMRSIGAGKAARSEEKHDLAYSAAAEFNVLADEVKAPFREAARKSCEAEIRARCAQEGVTDEEAIEDRIHTKVETILLSKEDEIAPLVRQKLEADGRFALYDNLAGAKRPVTMISKDAGTGKWTVTTVKDKEGNDLKKPVSAYDIDRNFSKLVDMYMEDAVAMGLVEHKTVKRSNMQAGNRMDARAVDVVNLAQEVKRDDATVKDLVAAVKAQLHFKIDIPDDEFEDAVKKALDDVTGLKRIGDDETKDAFSRFLDNYADGSYADQLSDGGRLANLVARRVENLKASDRAPLANLGTKSARCAQMLKTAYPGKVVDVKKAQEAIETTLRAMIERVQRNDPNDKGVAACKSNLARLMFNGRLFTDMLAYDIAHRAAGRAEIDLHNKFNGLLKCIEHYGKIDRSTFIRDAGQEVKA